LGVKHIFGIEKDDESCDTFGSISAGQRRTAFEQPSVSIVIPTLNSGKTLAECLGSIAMQDYPMEKIEVLIIDAGSTDTTIEIAEKFAVGRIISNPLKIADAAYAISLKEAKNDIVAFIDSDNILPSTDWLRRMVEPFQDTDIVGSSTLFFTYRPIDSAVTRYCALIGMNDPLCLYIGNYDRFSVITGRWTEADFRTVDDNERYFKVRLVNKSHLPTIGGNGFLVRRKQLLKSYPVRTYWFDIDAVYALTEAGHDKFAVVKIGIVHAFAPGIRRFFRKQRRRISDYLFFERMGQRLFPWKSDKAKPAKFVLSTVLVFPLLLDVIKGMRRVNDRILLFHIPACWVTLIAYGTGVFEALLGKRRLASRKNW
jgi:glycosyltransferase involved in cell wall biosynthesis